MRSIFLAVAIPFLTVLIVTSPASTGEKSPGDYFVSILEMAKDLELFSLDPAAKSDKEGFHGYKILGKTTVKDAETLKGLVTAFRTGVTEFRAGADKDFMPRHGIRFKLNGTTVDLLVCSRTKVYYNNNPGTDFGITKSPRAAFDKVLKAAGVELTKSAEN